MGMLCSKMAGMSVFEGVGDDGKGRVDLVMRVAKLSRCCVIAAVSCAVVERAAAVDC